MGQNGSLMSFKKVRFSCGVCGWCLPRSRVGYRRLRQHETTELKKKMKRRYDVNQYDGTLFITWRTARKSPLPFSFFRHLIPRWRAGPPWICIENATDRQSIKKRMMRFSRPALLGIFMAQSSSISDERKVYFFVALPFADCCRFFFLSKKREPIGDCTPISFKRPLAGQRRGLFTSQHAAPNGRERGSPMVLIPTPSSHH